MKSFCLVLFVIIYVCRYVSSILKPRLAQLVDRTTFNCVVVVSIPTLGDDKTLAWSRVWILFRVEEVLGSVLSANYCGILFGTTSSSSNIFYTISQLYAFFNLVHSFQKITCSKYIYFIGTKSLQKTYSQTACLP